MKINSTVIQEDSQIMDNMSELLSLISEFGDKYGEIKAKLPYSINLIDLLGANENAHSRILERLLQHKTKDGKFEILESFRDYLSVMHESFGKIEIEKPEITSQKENIDLWIRDEKYAIIVENKIFTKYDEDKQLSRYIEKTKDRYKEEQIYLIYMPGTFKEPDHQTLGRYRKKFEERFLILTFKDDILTWLNDKVLPIFVGSDEKLLSSALEQYIDHLKKMYNPNKKVYMDLEIIIKEKLGLNDVTSQEILRIITEKEEAIEKISELLQELKNSAEEDIFQQWRISLKKKYPKPESELIEGQKEAGLIIPVEDMKIRVFISKDGKNKDGALYCQVDTHCKQKKRNLPDAVREQVGELLKKSYDKDNTQIWKWFECTDFENAYDAAYKMILDVIPILIKMK